MAVVRPFKGIRPTKELVDKVAALPYDVMNTEEAREMVKGNPFSFLHVDKAQIDIDVYKRQMREWLSGRASPCQGERREFESRLPLHVRV